MDDNLRASLQPADSRKGLSPQTGGTGLHHTPEEAGRTRAPEASTTADTDLPLQAQEANNFSPFKLSTPFKFNSQVV